MRAPSLLLPLAASILLTVPAAAPAAILHTITPGESLTSIAEADGLTVPALAAANGLQPTAELIAGSQLVIPPLHPAPSSAPPISETPRLPAPRDYDSDDPGTVAVRAAPTRYLVKPGDTLTSIAQRTGTTVSHLAALNNLDPRRLLLAGTMLSVTGAERRQPPRGANSSPAIAQPVGQAAEGSAGAPPYPTAQIVSPSQVASIAAAYGVPGSLADAIAYQESGFNNDLVSAADARGVMQITPGTWAWIQQDLAGAGALAPASALSNVRAGALLLASLLRATGNNRQLAVAGYFQDLPSVLAHGMEPATRHYVADVLALQQRFDGE